MTKQVDVETFLMSYWFTKVFYVILGTVQKPVFNSFIILVQTSCNFVLSWKQPLNFVICFFHQVAQACGFSCVQQLHLILSIEVILTIESLILYWSNIKKNCFQFSSSEILDNIIVQFRFLSIVVNICKTEEE